MKMRLVLTLLVIGIFYALRLHDAITYDGVYTLYSYANSPFEALLRYTLPNNHQLHSLMVWFSTSLMGDSIIAVRLPTFFVSMLSLSMIYQLAQRFYPKHIAWLLMILVAVHPLYIQYSIESRGYMLTALLLLLLIERIYFSKLGNKKNSYIILLLAGGLLITLPTMIIAIVGCLLWGRSFHHTKLYRQFVVLPLIMGCIGGGMFYVYPLMQGLFANFSQQFGYKSISQFVEVFAGDYILSSPAALISFLLLLICIVRYRKAKTQFPRLFVILLLMCMAVLSLEFIVSGSLLYPRNLFFLVPIWGLVLGEVFYPLSDSKIFILLVVLYLIGNLFYTSLQERSENDYLLEDIATYALDSDYLVFGCCRNGPMIYELQHRGQGHLIDGNKAYKRVVIFPVSDTIEKIVIRYELEIVIDDCYVGDWNRFDPLICEVSLSED